jgi:hypothetical protein
MHSDMSDLVKATYVGFGRIWSRLLPRSFDPLNLDVINMQIPINLFGEYVTTIFDYRKSIANTLQSNYPISINSLRYDCNQGGHN